MSERATRRGVTSVAAPIIDAGRSDSAVVRPPRPLWPQITSRRARTALPRITSHLALVALLTCCAALVIFAASGPTVLVWHSELGFPSWMAGPAHGLFGRLPHGAQTLSLGFACVTFAMLIPYGLVLLCARELSMRTIWIFVLVVDAILLIGPPLQASDLFNYLAYARLGALHGLSPYSHVIAAEPHDPASLLASWHHWRSPYGPLFTASTYPLGLMPLPVAYWVLKAATVAMNIALVWLVGKCARLTGRDPRWAVLFVAANPIFLVQEVGGFHNDVFMMVPSLAAIAYLLSGRYRSSGAAVAVAVAVKFTAGLILPFLLLGARSWRRRASVVSGVVLAGVPLVVLSVALFGFSLPNFAGQTQQLTAFSLANLLGWGLGLGGGAPVLLKVLELCVVAVVVVQLLRNRDWVGGAGWATAALIASLGWLWPWYLVWLLPLAAIASSARLRGVALLLTVYLVITSATYTTGLLARHGINPLASPVGQAAQAAYLKYR